MNDVCSRIRNIDAAQVTAYDLPCTGADLSTADHSAGSRIDRRQQSSPAHSFYGLGFIVITNRGRAAHAELDGGRRLEVLKRKCEDASEFVGSISHFACSGRLPVHLRKQEN